MIQAIRRKQLFATSPFADALVASFQQSYASGLDESDPADRVFLERYYDHRVPFNAAGTIDNHTMVMAYPAADKASYRKGIPKALAAFFERMNIDELYLLDFLAGPWKSFPFATFHDRNKVKPYLRGNDALLLNREGLLLVFPHFLFSGIYDRPVIFLVAESAERSFAADLCDDGNLHLRFPGNLAGEIVAAASASGWVTGDERLCSEYSFG